MLVNNRREEDHLKDLKETFNTLRSYNMKLKPGKCAFEVTVGKFLGFKVSQRGIETNPEERERSAKPQQQSRSTEQVHIKGNR